MYDTLHINSVNKKILGGHNRYFLVIVVVLLPDHLNHILKSFKVILPVFVSEITILYFFLYLVSYENFRENKKIAKLANFCLI